MMVKSIMKAPLYPADYEKQSEPVAWMNEHGEISEDEHWAYPTPLYTTPQTKPLSDDEILDEIADCYDQMTEPRLSTSDLMVLARAIEAKVRGQ